MEGDFRRTHEWSTGKAGAGILENDGEVTWNEALTNTFECCFDLLPIMGDRASSQPKFINSNPANLDADPDEEASFHPCDGNDDGDDNEESVVAVPPAALPPVPPAVDADDVAVDAATEQPAQKPPTKKTPTSKHKPRSQSSQRH